MPDYETGVREVNLLHRLFLDLLKRMRDELLASTDPDHRAALFDEPANYAASVSSAGKSSSLTADFRPGQ